MYLLLISSLKNDAIIKCIDLQNSHCYQALNIYNSMIIIETSQLLCCDGKIIENCVHAVEFESVTNLCRVISLPGYKFWVHT